MKRSVPASSPRAHNRRDLLLEANRLLKDAGFWSRSDPNQRAFERGLILTPPNGKASRFNK